MSMIGTFKDVLLDSLIGNPDNQVPYQKKSTEAILTEALAATKFKNIRKKKAKGQVFT